jgi:hypothetical protein
MPGKTFYFMRGEVLLPPAKKATERWLFLCLFSALDLRSAGPALGTIQGHGREWLVSCTDVDDQWDGSERGGIWLGIRLDLT